MRGTKHPVLFGILLAIAISTAVPVLAQQPNVTTTRDVIYGRVDGAALLADIAYPAGREGLPAILSVHGGRWRAGNRTDASSIKVDEWAAAGFFSMSIDYRLVGSTPAPAAYQDFLCAIRWLHAHAREYHVDPQRIYLIGQSAGGQMVSLAATLGAGQYAKTGGWDDAPMDFRAVISVAGAYDLNTLSWGNLWTPLAGNVESERATASPLKHVSSSTKPLLVIHSDDDKSVPIQQAVDMSQALEKAGVKTRFVHYKDRGHMGVTDEVIKEARAFIAEVESRK
jgi:acetyl esterase/lipase